MIRKWLRNWLMAGTAPEAVPVEPVKRKAPAYKMAAQHSQARADAKTFVERNPAPTPPPGVPKEAKIAMDDAYGGVGAWAGVGAGWASGGFLGYAYLAELTQIPEYRRPSEIIAEEMTREWIELTAEDSEDDLTDTLKEIEAAMRHFNVQKVFHEAAEQDGFFGRCHIYIDTGKGEDKDVLAALMPLKPAAIPKGGLKGLRNVEAMWTYPMTYNSSDPLNPTYYKPQQWFVMGKLVHSSRLITLVSREVPDILKPSYSFGGLSLSQLLQVSVNNWLRTRQSVSDLIHSFATSILKTDLSAVMEGDGTATADLINRAELFQRTRDNQGVTMLDMENEDFVVQSAPLGSLDKLQAQAQEHMAAVAGIPLMIYFGLTPSGLNATGEGEIRVFYDAIASRQNVLLRPGIQRVLDVIQLHLFGEINPAISFKFKPLWQQDESESATNRKTDADTDVEYINAGVISAEEVRTRIANDQNSGYQGLTGPAPEPPEDDTNGSPSATDPTLDE